jgi:hypothetical protein
MEDKLYAMVLAGDLETNKSERGRSGGRYILRMEDSEDHLMVKCPETQPWREARGTSEQQMARHQ